MALDFGVLAELKKLEMELNEVQNNLTQALSQTPEINRSLQPTRATTDSSIQSNLVAPEDNENANTIEADSSEGINRDDVRSREDIGVSVSSTLENSSRIHKKPSYSSSSPYGISPSSIGESESLHTQAFMVRVSSPLKQSYIPEPILESDEEDTVDDVSNLSIQNNNVSLLDTLAEEKEMTSEEEGSEDSESISLEPYLNEQRSIDQQAQTETLVSEPESMEDNNQEIHKAEKTGRRESLLDPVHRLKELLVSQPHQAEYSDIEPSNLLQPKAGEISTIESVDNVEKEKDTNEQFLLKRAHIDSLPSVIDNISTTTTSKSEFSAKPPDDPDSLFKSVDDPASIAEPEPANDSSLLEETREVSSITPELLDDDDASSLQKTRDISNAESVDDDFLFRRFRDVSSSTTESVDDTSSVNKSEADFYWTQTSTDAYAPQKLVIRDPSLIRRENSSSSELDFELNKNRPLPESFDSDDLREIKDRVKRKNSYVSKRKMLEQEETGLTFWLNLNAKKEPPKVINDYKPKRNPITETAFKSTPPSTPTAKTYSSSPLTTVSPLSQQPTQKTSRASLDMYSLNSTSSLTNSTKSSKSSKSSRTSLDISIQVSSLYNRHLSPPSSPKPKSTFLSLPGLSRRTSFNKVTRPSFISPPIISSPITSPPITSSPMNQPVANVSSSSLSSPPRSPPPSTPKRQRRFSFQAVTSRFSFSQPSNNQAKALLDAAIVETDDDSSDDEFDPMAEVDEDALNKLCDVLPHANRDLLTKYLQKAGGKDDLMAVGLYMKDLKSGEINGT